MGLIDVYDKFPVDFTHIHTDMKSFSTIDHFMVNERLLNYIIDCQPLHLGDNRSRHSPVMLKINIGNIPLQKDFTIPRPRQPAWKKANNQQRNKYTRCLFDRINRLEIPNSLDCKDPHCSNPEHRKERDTFMLDLITNWIEASHESIPLSGGKKTTIDPDKGCTIKSNITGWKTEIEPLRKDALFWHAVWISAEKPTTGALHSVMAHSRNKYHYAVRKAKKLSKQIRANNLLDAANRGEADLLKEMKHIRAKTKQAQTVPDNVEEAEGLDEVLDKFRDVYQTLYNSAESTDEMNIIKAKLKECIGPSCLDEVDKITGAILKEACTRMKPGKTDVTDGFASDAHCKKCKM